MSATVNVTIDLKLWVLVWDGLTETYRITFNGSDVQPGFGTHILTIQTTQIGYENQVDITHNLTLREEPSGIMIDWTNTNDITYIETTMLSVNYTMSNGSAVTGAEINVTIDSYTWNLTWNGVSELYEIQFNGTDSIPGFGVHSLTISAWKFGFQNWSDTTQTFTMSEEPTTLEILWENGNNITFVQSTVLMLSATVNVTIDLKLWVLVWDGLTETYQIVFNGSDTLPGFGTHDLIIRSEQTGYEGRLNSTWNITLREEPTNILITWSNSNNITYFEHTVLSINYTMSNWTVIPESIVNVTIGGNVWPLIWSLGDEVYQIQFNGSDIPPGIGTHNLTIQAWKYGFEEQANTSQKLTLPVVPTIIQIQWSNGNNITTVENTILSVNYTMYNETVIPSAEVNATIGVNTWTLTWNNSTKVYEVTFTGVDNPPGYGTHSISIQAWKVDFEDQSDSTQVLTLLEEPTSMQILWSNGNNITFVEQTTLRVRYLMSNGSAIQGASVIATIGVNVWMANWQAVSQEYQIVFSGSDNPPGLGNHSLLVQAFANGFVYASNNSEILTLTEETTNIRYTWALPKLNNISYLENTTLFVSYEMSNGTPIQNAVVNVTIGDTTWHMAWNGANETYEVQFFGNDDPPGFGTHNVTLKASKFGFVSVVDTTEELTIRVEDASLPFTWSNTNTITFLNDSTISVAYLLRDGTPIIGAMVNVTIGIVVWNAILNVSDGTYYVIFNGTDDPPGFGNHSLTISAWKLNYQGQVNSSSLIINKENTSVSLAWSNGNDITYVQFTTLNVTYTMSNGTSIPGATVNVTIGSDTWTLQWTGAAYEIQFNGSDSIPGLGMHGLTVRAEKFGYEGKTNSSQTLSIAGELGAIKSEWITIGNITFVESTILQVNYTMSNGTAIPSATVNVTISGTTWNLTWHAASETYRIVFYGDDNPPGINTHSPLIQAWRFGFDYVIDSSMTLVIRKEPTSLIPTWFASQQNDISYFEHTYLFVDYLMSNGTMISGAIVNVTIGSDIWLLKWNATEGAYAIRFNGSDLSPGLGTHDLVIQASTFGYSYAANSSQKLTLRPDPTTVEVTWLSGNNITFIEHSTLLVNYRMSNGSDITGAQLNVSISSVLWPLTWNFTANAYSVVFNGTDNPPGLGIHSLTILASKTYFADQLTITSLTIRTDDTSVDSSWMVFDTEYLTSVPLSLNLSSSDDEFVISANVTIEVLGVYVPTINQGNGTYSAILGPLLNIGVHTVNVTFSGFWFNTVSVFLTLNVSQKDTIPLDSVTSISSSVIYYDETTLIEFSYQMLNGSIVPGGTSRAHVNGIEEIAVWNTDHWELVLSGSSLGLGLHDVMINVSAYGYTSTTYEFQITVNSIPTLLEVQGRYWLYVNDTSQLRITFRDARTNDPIVADSVRISYPEYWPTLWCGSIRV
ncbi:MAG: hypothetical protein ACXACD_15550 [Candidatus Thorarchaeota archaeon]